MKTDEFVYRHGETYEKGSHVHWAGCAWIAQERTRAVPGTPGAWTNVGRLSRKRSDDGTESRSGGR
jgi:hypothetical protein